jgi:transcriptional regulator with XRE-family HTH domain
VTGDSEDLLIVERARLVRLRQCLGVHLAACRYAAGMSQEELATALGRTRSLVSKVEHGSRGMPEPLWQLADEVCRAKGALISEHRALVQAERDYRARWRVQHRLDQRAAGLARAAQIAARGVGVSRALLCDAGGDACRDAVLDGVSRELAQELRAVMERVVRSVGRRRAMQLASWMLATMGLSTLDADEYTRVAHAVTTPGRVDAKVVNNLAATLAQCRRLEDTLGPRAVLETVLVQHELVHHLLHEGAAEQWHKPLRLLDSSTAAAIGTHLIDMGDPGAARDWFAHARKAGHDGGNPAYAAYAAANLSYVARLAGDTPAALDAAAAARSLAARTSDAQVQALAESVAAGAYALDGRSDACLAAVDRAHDLLTTATSPGPGAPAYWIDHSFIDSQFSAFFVLLNRPRQAVDAASNALARFDRTYVGRYALGEVRLGHALVLAGEIPEAVRVLGNAAGQAHLYPRLTAELRTTRALLQSWQHTQPVQELDAQLHACGVTV